MTDFNANKFNKPTPVRPTRPGGFPPRPEQPKSTAIQPEPQNIETQQQHPADNFLNPDRYHEPINPAGFPMPGQISHQPQAPQHLPLHPTTDYNTPQQNPHTPTNFGPPQPNTPQQQWGPTPTTPEITDNQTQTGWNKESILAVAFTILGAALVWFDIRAGIGLIAGIVLGHRSLRQNRTTGQKGKPLSIAALIIGYTTSAATLVLLGIGLIAAILTAL